MDNYEEMLSKIIQSINSTDYLCDLYNSLKSSTMRKLIDDNILLNRKIEELAIIICNHIKNNNPNYKMILEDILNELYVNATEEYKVDGSEALEMMGDKQIRSLIEITANHIELLKRESLIVDWLLLTLICDAVQYDYRSLKQIMINVVDIIGDSVPGISDLKNAIEIIRNFASIVNELDPVGDETYFACNLHNADKLILEWELRNSALSVTYGFLCSFTFIQKEIKSNETEVL